MLLPCTGGTAGDAHILVSASYWLLYARADLYSVTDSAAYVYELDPTNNVWRSRAEIYCMTDDSGQASAHVANDCPRDPSQPSNQQTSKLASVHELQTLATKIGTVSANIESLRIAVQQANTHSRQLSSLLEATEEHLIYLDSELGADMDTELDGSELNGKCCICIKCNF